MDHKEKKLINVTGIAVTAWLYLVASLVLLSAFAALGFVCLMFARWLHG